MPLRLAVCCVLCLTIPLVTSAQPITQPTGEPQTVQPSQATQIPLPGRSLFDRPNQTSRDPGFWAPFTTIGGDLAQFLSTDTIKVLGLGGAGAMAAHRWDVASYGNAAVPFRPGLFKAGNVGGSFLVQAGTSVGLYSIGRLAGSHEIAAAGSDLIRAQILSQAIVQAGKLATQRQRPDASNNHSLPSGHSAAAFAAATVLQRHFGWAVGAPAYAVGAYVAASRLSADKHHLSDVMLGAAIGIAAGRSVTIGAGKARFNMAVVPTLGGAAVTFTKR